MTTTANRQNTLLNTIPETPIKNNKINSANDKDIGSTNLRKTVFKKHYL